MIEILPLPAFMRLAGGSNSSESERNREETERKRERVICTTHTLYRAHTSLDGLCLFGLSMGHNRKHQF